MNTLKTTNYLLLVIVIPIVFYLLQVLNFVFIPLFASMFISFLFLPLMRWLKKKKVPQIINIVLVISIIVGFLQIAIRLVKLTSNEILSANSQFFEKAQVKLVALFSNIESLLGFEGLEFQSVFNNFFQNDNTFQKLGSSLDFVSSTISMTLMTLFFVVLLLSDSFDFEKLLNKTIFKFKYSSVKMFRNIEKDIRTFVKVKFVISLFTGIGFSLACVFFDVSFPIFWGVFAFAINFVQMIGSVISVILLSLFSFVELDPTGTLLFFIITIIAVQVIMGGILEPVMMGKTFSINVLTILIMLMVWGFIWGIPGLIMSIPITVFLKIILEQFPKTKLIAELMEGSPRKIKISRKK